MYSIILKQFKRNSFIFYSILVKELFLLDRELELEIKGNNRGDMQRCQPGTLYAKARDLAFAYMTFKNIFANQQLVISTKTNINISDQYWFSIYFIF